LPTTEDAVDGEPLRGAGSVHGVIERHRTQPGTRPRTPEEAWRVLAAGNARFMADERAHPHQDVHFRGRIALRQNPFAIFFGCADSRVAAEIIFDQGLGDLFVVRTAGHVVDPSVLGSVEFGVAVLDCPLIVVLGHDSCGAVKAAREAVRTGDVPGGFLRDIVERVTPSVLAASRGGHSASIEEIEREHVERTCALIAERSTVVADRLRAGTLGIVGAEYDLAEGEARVVRVLGDLGDSA
jgi:carbonic anhydrase